MPPAIFGILHDQGHALFMYCYEVHKLLRLKEESRAMMNDLDAVEQGFLLLDDGYNQLTEAIRTKLGVSDV